MSTLTLRRTVGALGVAVVVAAGAHAVPATAADPNTTTTLTDSPDPTIHGVKVTLVATVARNDGSAIKPTGQVAFSTGEQSLGTATVSKGKAVLKTGDLPIGDDTVTATYLGDGASSSSSGTTTHHVDIPDSTTTVTPSNGSVVYGTPIVATVKIAKPGTGPMPSGTMTWYDGENAIATTTVTSGKTSLPGTKLEPGDHPSLGAFFTSDDGSEHGSSVLFALTVVKASTNTTLTSSTNPSNQGQPVTFTATVTRTNSKAPLDADVVFYAGELPLGSMTPNSKGVAKLTTSDLPPGTTTITATFGPSPHFSGSQASLDQVVYGPAA